MKRQVIHKDKYLSVSQVSVILGMSRTAVYKKVKRGDIKSIKFGKSIGISRHALTNVEAKVIDPAKKKRIDRAVKKVMGEYGDLLRKLGNE